MAKTGASWVAFVCLCSSTAMGAVTVQEPPRLGAELQVNSFTFDFQTQPDMASDSAGNFVVVWHSYFQDGSGIGVFGRRFDAAGNPQAAEFQVNSYTPSIQRSPAVGRGTAGSFVVVWVSNQGSSGYHVFGRRFDATGAALAAEFQVNTLTIDAFDPSVGLDADGDFVVVWSSMQDGSGTGIAGQRFGSAGARLGGEFQVNSYTPANQDRAQVAVEDDGDFVVAWVSADQDGSGEGIFFRRFSSSGAAGIETLANAYTINSQAAPDVVVNAGGGFVVTWDSLGHDGSGWGVFAQRFNNLGSPVAAEFQVNVYTLGYQIYPFVDMDAAGSFVVTWRSRYQDSDSSDGAFARYFDSLGEPRSADFEVNSYTLDRQYPGGVAMTTGGGFVITWVSGSFTANQDGSKAGVFAQRFLRPQVLDIDGDGNVGALTDGLLVLRFLFGFTGTTLTAGAVGSGCTRCNAAAIEPYLQGLV